jgi:hypothetical protein
VRDLSWAEALTASGTELATFRHPLWRTVVEEARIVNQFQRDLPEVVTAQLARYTAAGFPDDRGVFSTACLVRRATDGIAAFQSDWWTEIDRGSRRDQLSLPYILWRRPEVALAVLEGQARGENPYFQFDFTDHL